MVAVVEDDLEEEVLRVERLYVRVADALEIALPGRPTGAVALEREARVDAGSILRRVLEADDVAPVIRRLLDEPLEDAPRIVRVGDARSRVASVDREDVRRRGAAPVDIARPPARPALDARVSALDERSEALHAEPLGADSLVALGGSPSVRRVEPGDELLSVEDDAVVLAVARDAAIGCARDGA